MLVLVSLVYIKRLGFVGIISNIFFKILLLLLFLIQTMMPDDNLVDIN